MSKLGVAVVVCGVAIAVVACKKDNAARPPAAGSGTGSASGSAPAPAPAPDAPPAPPDAAATALVVSKLGVGPLTDLQQTGGDEQTQQRIAGLFEPLGFVVSFDVMDVGGEVESEEGYFSVKKADKEVLQIFRGSDAAPNMVVHVVDATFATTDGFRVGDKISAIAAKRPGLICLVKKNEALGLITCRDPAEPELVFALDAQDFQGKPSDKPLDLAKHGDRTVVDIVR